MKDLQGYIDKAMELREFTSLRQLSLALGKDAGVVSEYLRGRNFPDDPTMVKLAAFANSDPTKALIDLNSWRVKDPDVRRIYRKLAKTMASVVVIGTMLGPPGASKGHAERAMNRSTLSVAINVYYGVFCLASGGLAITRPIAEIP